MELDGALKVRHEQMQELGVQSSQASDKGVVNRARSKPTETKPIWKNFSNMVMTEAKISDAVMDLMPKSHVA